MSLAFEMKTFLCERGLFQKVMTHKLCQNANIENGGTTIQIGTLHVLLNILSISLLSRVHDTSGWLFRDAKRVVMSFYVLKKINQMQVAG